MSKEPKEPQTQNKAEKQQIVRLAYTLNYTQPVLCSLIGDKPLSCQSEQDEIHQEILDHLTDIEYLENKSQSTSGLNEGFGIEHDSSFLKLETFLKSMESLEKGSFVDRSAIRIERLKKIFARSFVGQSYLKFAVNHDVEIVFGTASVSGLYDRHFNKIILNPLRDDAELILVMAREMRRLWQHRNGAGLNPLSFHPDQAVLIHRAQQADLAISMIRIGWELHKAHFGESWLLIENSSLFDLGSAMARESFMDFRTLENGLAQSSVFEAWFLSERSRVKDKVLVQNMLADYNGYVFGDTESSRLVAKEVVGALGTMPVGKNYLSPFVHTIMSDPIFTEVRDRSNANFLWFIKFERSFRETERELERIGQMNEHESALTQSNTKKQRPIKGELIEIKNFIAENNDNHVTARRQAQGKVATIISFENWKMRKSS